MTLRSAFIAAALVAATFCSTATAGSLTLLGVGKGAAAGGGSPPAYAWSTNGNIATGSTSATTSKGANTINSGDLLLMIQGLIDNSNANHFVACPSGWTGLSWSPDFDSGNNSGFNTMGCWKIAGAGESGAYSNSWTNTNTLVGEWVLIDFTGANAAPVDATGITRNGSASSTTSLVSPTLTSGGGNRLFLSCAFGGGSSQTFTGVPAGMAQQFTYGSGGTVKVSCATSTVGSGATGTATWTTGNAGSGTGVSLLIKP